MNKKIIVFCGKKQTGKSSGAKFLVGYALKRASVIPGFSQDENGDLLIPFPTENETEWGVLDIYRRDEEFIKSANQMIFPTIRVFSFATELKEAIISIFGINRDLVYGSDQDKDTKTHIKWSDMRKLVGDTAKGKRGMMTIRELLQFFGTEICRTIYDNCWIDATFKKIENCNSPICIIDDCRFENEYKVSLEKEAHLILLKKEDSDESHSSESFVFPEENMNLIINKDEVSLIEKNKLIEENLIENEIFTQVIQ